MTLLKKWIKNRKSCKSYARVKKKKQSDKEIKNGKIRQNTRNTKMKKVGEQQTEVDPRSKTTADKAYNLIGYWWT